VNVRVLYWWKAVGRDEGFKNSINGTTSDDLWIRFKKCNAVSTRKWFSSHIFIHLWTVILHQCSKLSSIMTAVITVRLSFWMHRRYPVWSESIQIYSLVHKLTGHFDLWMRKRNTLSDLMFIKQQSRMLGSYMDPFLWATASF
jgi:hypothetical protein